MTPFNAPRPTPTRKSEHFYGYVIVGLATLILFVVGGAWYTYGVFFKPLADEFGWSRAETAGAHSMFLVMMGFLFIFTGRLTDRFGPRLTISIGATILGLAYILMAHISALWQLYLFWGLLAAMGQSGEMIPLMSTVARWFVKKRGLMTGIVLGGAGLGNMVMPPLATRLIEAYGWRTAYVIFGILVWVVVIGAAQFLKRDPEKMGLLPDGETVARARPKQPHSGGYSRRAALGSSRLWILTTIYFCFGFFMHSVAVHLVPHAQDIGIAPLVASSILAALGGTNLAGRVCMGGAGDRLGNRRTLVFCFSLALAAFLWLPIASGLWMLYLFAILFGFAAGGVVALESILVAEQFGLKAHGAIVGILHFSGTALGGAIGTFLSGKLFDLAGNYQVIFMVFAGLAAIGLLLSILLKPPREPQPANYPS